MVVAMGTVLLVVMVPVLMAGWLLVTGGRI
jgi:hypothetical protein